MYATRLRIDTSDKGIGPSSGRLPSPGTHAPSLNSAVIFSSNATGRLRSASSASTTSSLSLVSPAPSSGNPSSTSLPLPNDDSAHEDSRSASPATDETVQLSGEYVLAMHDFSPHHQNANCLSFRAGQVIHVLNRDSSGWWDGELEGRRGWFPSNYVNADVGSTSEEEPPSIPRQRTNHLHTMSATSYSPSSSDGFDHRRNHRRPSVMEALGSDIDTYCPPLMVPLLHGLSLLQGAVRQNRVPHFQPSTACIISCVRTVLATTDCLPRDAPLLRRFPVLAQVRKGILSVLASLVAQAKKASDESVEEEAREAEVEAMLRLGGQVFAHVRRFLAVAVQCGVDLPERKASPDSGLGSPEDDGLDEGKDAGREDATPTPFEGGSGRSSPEPQLASRMSHATTPMSAMRAKSLGDLRNQHRLTVDDDSAPLLPHRTVVARSKREMYLAHRTRENKHKQGMASVSSISSTSSVSSSSSSSSSHTPRFPSGPTSTPDVTNALRHTHDNYLSTIAAFIGHAHSHSRASHASSTGHMYNLVREIVEGVCKLLTIVEAVMRHPDIPPQKVASLGAAKEGLYSVTSILAESVRQLTSPLPQDIEEEEEKQALLRSATGALKAGADCVTTVKICLNRSMGDRQFILELPSVGDLGAAPFTPRKFVAALTPVPDRSSSLNALQYLNVENAEDEEDLTIQAQTPPSARESSSTVREVYDNRSETTTNESMSLTSGRSEDTPPTSIEDNERLVPTLTIPLGLFESDLASPTSYTPSSYAPSYAPSYARTDDATTWEGSVRNHHFGRSMDSRLTNGDLAPPPMGSIYEFEPAQHTQVLDYPMEDAAYNGDGHLVGATLEVLVAKMTPHDSIVDPAFSAVFFLTFRLFATSIELCEALIARYNITPPSHLLDSQEWQNRRGLPVRLRVSNFIKLWLEMYWRPGVDDPVLLSLMHFTREGLAPYFPGPSARIMELIDMRRNSPQLNVGPRGDRIRDPGMSINPPSAPTSEIPRPTMTKTLLSALRTKNFTSISIMDFDALELARQLTIMECNLYCAIQPEEILETGQEGAKCPNVRAVSSLSTIITGWVAESILDEHDIKKRTMLVKFFIKIADRCASLHNYSTLRSILAALDSSTISRLHQTWTALPQKNKLQLEPIRKLADHSRNYREYRSKLRNRAPPAVPFLGLYLTDVTFCREGNPSHRASPIAPDKMLLNFNKYHKLARIVQDMQRFQVPYTLKEIPEVQEYLDFLFEKSKHHGDLQDLYRRSLMVEPKQPADAAPSSDMRQLFNWATRSQQPPTPA